MRRRNDGRDGGEGEQTRVGAVLIGGNEIVKVRRGIKGRGIHCWEAERRKEEAKKKVEKGKGLEL